LKNFSTAWGVRFRRNPSEHNPKILEITAHES
jgi:hypothetical protein